LLVTHSILELRGKTPHDRRWILQYTILSLRASDAFTHRCPWQANALVSTAGGGSCGGRGPRRTLWCSDSQIFSPHQCWDRSHV